MYSSVKVLFLLLWLVLVPAIAHLAFSSLGYNPTDDGWILAYSRDILLGLVPHRDVGSFHMAGSFYLWTPAVYFGGDYVFWIARLVVWLEHALIAWLWVLIIMRLLRLSLRPSTTFVFALMTFIFDVHTFPIMPWTTTDALLFLSLGLALVTRDSRPSKLGGYALLGVSYLCKQNFLVIAPLSLVVLNDWRTPRHWLAIGTPGVVYAWFLLLSGTLHDAMLQLSSETGLADLGYFTYVKEGGVIVPAFFLGLLLIALCHSTIDLKRLPFKPAARLTLGSVMLYAALLAAAVHLAIGDVAWDPSFALFGLVGGATTAVVIARLRPGGYAQAGLLVLTAAWTSSISIGYNTPAPVAGIMILLLLCYARAQGQLSGFDRLRSILLAGGLGLAVLVSTSAFVWTREEHIYREQPAQNLSYALDGVFPGGKMIRTNRNTYDFLADLKRVIVGLRGRPYAILPDCPGCWVESTQPDWLPLPWPAVTEIDAPSVLDRVESALEAHRGRAVVLVTRYVTAQLADGRTTFPEISNAVTWYVHQHFRRIGQTRYFYLYE